MTDKQHPAQFDWATELSDAQEHITLSAQEANEIGARLRSMGEKLKAYEDLDEAASDVQLLRMGYAAARMEIESLQARIKTMAEEHADELMVAHLDGRMCAEQPAGAQQPGAAYAALPDADRDYMRKVVAVAVTMLFDGYKEDVMRVFSTGELSEFVTITAAMGGERVEGIYRRAWDLLSLPVRASHGQAPAQAAPAAVAEPVEWRELAARVMDALADAQEQTNSAYPAHASRYPAWEAHLRWLRWHADMFRTGKPVGSGAGQPAVLAALAAAPTTQPAPQQEAQEPVMIYHGDCIIDCGEHGHHHVELLRMIPAGSKLYTAPQPTPTPQADSQPAPLHEGEWINDAGRIKWLLWRVQDLEAQLAARPPAYSVQDLQPVHDAVTIDLLNERVAYLERKLKEADSVLEDAERLERERICAAIKAEDDYCVDHGDYMLDSDDCIKIVRGEWVRPDFSVAAARKQGANHD